MDRVSLQTADRDEAEDRCGQVYFPHRLTVLHDLDSFSMSLAAAALGPVSVGLLGYSGTVTVTTGDLETAYEINVPLTGTLRTWVGHDEVCATPELAAVYRPEGRTVLHGWGDGGRLLGVKIERSALEQLLADLTDTPIRSTVRFAASLDLRSVAGRQWWALVRSLTEVIGAPDGPLARPMVARPLVQSLIGGLLYTAQHDHRDGLDGPVPTPRNAAICRAVDLLEAAPEQAWTVVGLARLSGLSVRALQEGFARHLDTTPMTHLRRIRLRRAHTDLQTADPGRHTVADIATAWGFTHLGRFAEQYRQAYGTLPSQTLRAE